jgi:hypothetical protein
MKSVCIFWAIAAPFWGKIASQHSRLIRVTMSSTLATFVVPLLEILLETKAPL